MTGYDLSVILSKYTKPPTHANKSEVFVLYSRVTGKQADRNCLNCAIECYLELKRLAKEYGENSIPLNSANQKNMKEQKPTLKIYTIPKPFRVHGDPKVYANWNTTDEEVEMLIKRNRALTHHFKRIDGGDVLDVNKPIKVIRTSKKQNKNAEHNNH